MTTNPEQQQTFINNLNGGKIADLMMANMMMNMQIKEVNDHLSRLPPSEVPGSRREIKELWRRRQAAADAHGAGAAGMEAAASQRWT